VRDVICNDAVPFRQYCGGVVTRTRNVSEYILVLALCLVTIIKTRDEFRNVGDAALGRDAYAMSHLSAEACTQWLAAGPGNGYQVTEISLQQQQLL